MKKFALALFILMMVLSACAPAATVAPTAEPTTVVTEAPQAQTEEPVAEQPTKVPPTEAPVVEEPTAAPVFKEITMANGREGFLLKGNTIETDDAFPMMGFGMIEGLTWIDFDGNLAPKLAVSWTQVDDLTWEFKLRTGVFFQNGEPFNAAAVVKSLEYIRNAPTPPRGFTATTFDSAEAIGEDTVRIHTATPDMLMPNRLSAPNAGILAPSAYIAESGPIDPFGTGTGPFTLTELMPEQYMVLEKNPNYWGGPVTLDKVTVLYIPDMTIKAGMLQNGEIIASTQIPTEQLPILENIPGLVTYVIAEPRTVSLHFNMQKEVLQDIRIRQVIGYAIDKQGIVDAILEGYGVAGKGVITDVEAWQNLDVMGLPYDPEKAAALLAEAGYEPGALTLQIATYTARTYLPPVAVALQDMLGKVGINVEVRIAVYESLLKDLQAGNYDMFILARSHVLDTYDPEGFFTSDYTCAGTFNWDYYCNEEFDALLAQAKTLSDPQARYEIYYQLQSIIDSDVVGVHLFYTGNAGGYWDTLLNFREHPLGRGTLYPELDVAP